MRGTSAANAPLAFPARPHMSKQHATHRRRYRRGTSPHGRSDIRRQHSRRLQTAGASPGTPRSPGSDSTRSPCSNRARVSCAQRAYLAPSQRVLSVRCRHVACDYQCTCTSATHHPSALVSGRGHQRGQQRGHGAWRRALSVSESNQFERGDGATPQCAVSKSRSYQMHTPPSHEPPRLHKAWLELQSPPPTATAQRLSGSKHALQIRRSCQRARGATARRCMRRMPLTLLCGNGGRGGSHDKGHGQCRGDAVCGLTHGYLRVVWLCVQRCAARTAHGPVDTPVRAGQELRVRSISFVQRGI